MKITKRFYEDQYKQEFDVRDLFKECPNCGLLWMRVTGCPNTTCGNKPGFFDYLKNRIYNKYVFNINNGRLNFTRNQK